MRKFQITSFMALCIGAFSTTGTIAQSISPQVIATTGGHGTTANAQLSWTVGEVAITTLSGGSNMLTQGFHQPYDITTMIEETPSGMRLMVYPNPTTDQLQIALSGDHGGLALTMHDISGRSVFTTDIRADQQSMVVRMESYAAGTYVLRIFSPDATVNHAYRIVKN